MTGTKARRLVSQIFMGIIPAAIIIGIFMFHVLLQRDTSLISPKFITEKQSGDMNTLYLQGSFDKELPEYETIWLFAENAEIEMRFGSQVFRFNERGDIPAMLRSPGSNWFSFVSPGIESGETVEFAVHSYYGESDRASMNLLANLHIGDGIGLYQLMLRQIDSFGIISLFTMIAGIIFLMEGSIDIMFDMAADGMRIALFGFFCFSGGFWCVTDMVYPYLTLIISSGWVAAFLDIIPIMLFPIALALMIRYYMRGKLIRRVMTLIVVSEILLAFVCLLLQMTGRADLMEQQLFMEIVAIPFIVAATICILLELKKYRDNYLLMMFVTVLPVFISNLLDGLNILYPFMPRRTLMQYGFAISFMLLTLQLVSYAKTEVVKTEALQRMERELSDSRISIMLSQIQPHFLYNSLQGIKRLCDVEPKRASEALEHFAYYLRGNLYSLSDSALIPFEREIDHVEDYLYLEQMRFKERVNVKWEIGFTCFSVPSLSLQPIVENAVRHGLTKKEGGGTITVRSEELEDAVLITISDDGIGFDTSAAPDTSRPHIGIENVRKRVEAQCRGILQIHSEIGIGTEVKITLPKERLKAKTTY